MKYIGNYNNLITLDLMNRLETRNGDTVPVWQPERWTGRKEWEDAREILRPGYAHLNLSFQQFNISSEDMKDFIFDFKIPNDDRKISWWFIKLLPGQMQPMHFDPHLIEIVNPKRYTVFLQDWKPGHIFTWSNKMICDYKAGDLFEWNDPMCYHGCVNIGYENRYTLQITTHGT